MEISKRGPLIGSTSSMGGRGGYNYNSGGSNAGWNGKGSGQMYY